MAMPAASLSAASWVAQFLCKYAGGMIGCKEGPSHKSEA